MKAKRSIRIVTAPLIGLLIFLGAHCGRSPFGAPEASNDAFRIFANDFTNSDDNGMLNELNRVINSSQVTLDCAFSRLTRTDVADNLIARASSGVQVRIGLDVDTAEGEPAVTRLQNSGKFSTEFDLKTGSKLALGNKGDGTTFYNFCVADEQRIYLSTAAPDDTDLKLIPNVAMVMGTDEFGISREFTKELNLMTQGSFGNGKAKLDFATKFNILNQVIAIHWAPQENPMDVLATEISEASKSIRIYTSLFQNTSTKSDLNLPDVLKRRIERNVSVEIIATSQALFDTDSKLSELQGTAATLKQYFNSRNRVGLNLIIIDEGTSDQRAILYTGGFRSRANSSDDGVLLILKGELTTNFATKLFTQVRNQSTEINTTPTNITTANQREVVINEIGWMGSMANDGSSDGNDEFIELYNNTDNDINLSGWKFACTTDGSSDNSFVNLPTGAIIPARNYLVIAKFIDKAYLNAAISLDISITNSTKECTLTDGDSTDNAAGIYGETEFTGTIVDRIGGFDLDNDSTPGETTDDAFNKYDNNFYSVTGYSDYDAAIAASGRRSMERINLASDTDGTKKENWQTNQNSREENTDIASLYRERTYATPGSPNSTPDTGSAGSIIFSELHYAGSETDDSSSTDAQDDFFELYNTTGTSIAIGGWQVNCTTASDGSAVNITITIPYGESIAANSYYLVTSRSDKAIRNGNYTKFFALTSATRQCRLTDASQGTTSSYSAEPYMRGTLIDSAGTLTNTFATDGLGVENSGSERRSFERLGNTSDGTQVSSWQNNQYQSSNNTQIASGYRQITFASPNAGKSSAPPSIDLLRPVYFTTSTTHPNGVAKVSASSPAGNLSSASIDTISVTATSSTETTGITLTLTETAVDSGQFTSTATGAHLNFTTGSSSGNTLRVSSGDTITVTLSDSGNSYSDTALWYEQTLVINEVGSNHSSVTANDYIELYNPNSVAVNITGLVVARDSDCSISTNWGDTLALSGTLGATTYYLVGDDNWSGAPTPDNATVNFTINDNDCVGLLTSNSATTSSTNDHIVDLVGYGSASVFEGSVGDQMGGGNGECISRITNGIDTNNNANDFGDETISTCSPGSANPAVPFNVTGASATSATQLTINFNRAPNQSQAETAGNYCIALTSDGNCSTPDLTVSGASLSGNVVTLTTSSQTSGSNYTVYVSNVTAVKGGSSLGTANNVFSGFDPIGPTGGNFDSWSGGIPNSFTDGGGHGLTFEQVTPGQTGSGSAFRFHGTASATDVLVNYDGNISRGSNNCLSLQIRGTSGKKVLIKYQSSTSNRYFYLEQGRIDGTTIDPNATANYTGTITQGGTYKKVYLKLDDATYPMDDPSGLEFRVGTSVAYDITIDELQFEPNCP